MKISKILTALGMAAILFTSCKKDGDSGDNAINVDDNGNVVVGADADGALYSVMSHTFIGTSGTSFDQADFTYAWFGSYTAPLDAGDVTSNDVDLMNVGGGAFNWYMGFGMGGDIFSNGNNVTWKATGGASVPAFTHVDNSPFPTGGTFVLPSSININNSFTLSHAGTAGEGVVYQVLGNDGEVTKSAVGASNAVTFTSAEMKQVCNGGGDPIAFMVMPVSVKSSTVGGKKYYFVKQYQVLRETVTQ